MLEPLIQDVRYAFRALARRPGFSAVALITLALGIGANSAIFSLVRGVILKPLPYPEPERLVRIRGRSTRTGAAGNLSRPDFKDFARDNRTFEAMGAMGAGIGAFTLTGDGEPERVRAVNVSAGLFQVLGTVPAAGRLLQPQDDESNADVVVITYGFWQRRFGGDPTLVGRPILLGGQPNPVVGILPPEFRYPQPDGLGEPEIFAPMSFDPEYERSGRSIRAIGRLRPGVSLAEARADLSALAAQLERQYPTENFEEGVLVQNLLDAILGETRRALLILLAAVGCVLLVGCANLINLLLARGAGRQKELAVRVALGASRGRVIRQLLTENVVLGLAGGSAGLILAWWTTRVVVALGAGSIPRGEEVALDAQVVGFTAALALATSMLIGVLPSVRMSRVDVQTILKGSWGAAAHGIRSRLRGSLVAAEVAVCAVLLIAAGLLVKSFWRLASVEPGFQPDRVLSARMALPLARYEEGTQIPFYEMLYERVASHPGVRGVGAINILPLSGGYSCDGFRIDRRPVPRGQEPCAEARSVSIDYFRVMGIPLLRGRTFTPQDRAPGRDVVVINQAMARQHWPGEDPLGQTITYLRGGDADPREIVGVVGDTAHLGLAAEAPPTFYTPQRQQPSYHGMTLVVRADSDPAALTGVIRHELSRLDPDIPLYSVTTLENVLDTAVAQPRFRTVLLGAFAGLALVLALVGVYGVIAYTVSRRTHEIGIRMALGAAGPTVLRLILAQGMAPVLAGIAAGVVLALGLTRSLANLLFGVAPSDPAVFVGVPAMLFVASLAATLVPARRASRVDPLVALRTE
jgi:putative ABC transport system permease protein